MSGGVYSLVNYHTLLHVKGLHENKYLIIVLLFFFFVFEGSFVDIYYPKHSVSSFDYLLFCQNIAEKVANSVDFYSVLSEYKVNMVYCFICLGYQSFKRRRNTDSIDQSKHRHCADVQRNG